VYRTCLFCHSDLGRNDVVASLPIGRRLAFDAARGRLWVVCRRCEKWTLTPFEERWEALEECERRFREARKRVASDNIGLARLDEGLELVRIGEPLRPEFAAWRYGDQFGRRRRRAILAGAGLGAVGVGVLSVGLWAGVLGGGAYSAYQVGEVAVRVANRQRLAARVRGHDGIRLIVRRRHLEWIRLLPASGAAADWALRVRHTRGEQVPEGADARRAAVRLVAAVNERGAGRRDVDNAVSYLETLGTPDALLRSVARRRAPVRGRPETVEKAHGLPALDLSTRLALEMALNEEHERIALEGELALLELEWKEAEELAAIADRLLVPDEVEQQLDALRGRRSAKAAATASTPSDPGSGGSGPARPPGAPG
jgi:hypothetical protein